MLALFSFVIVILFSLIVVRIGTIALESTGLSRDIAQFQAQSAFSGVGYTTKESETMMDNPLRRSILRYLMLMGSAGLTSAVAALILTFIGATGTIYFKGFYISRAFLYITIIITALLIIYLISKTEFFDRIIKHILARPLKLMKSKMSLYDYEKVLGLSKGNSISSFEVPKRHWMVNKTIGKLKLEKEGVVVLGIFRKVHGLEEYIASPSDDFKIHNRDKIVVYANDNVVENLAKREAGRRGSKDRQEAVEIQRSIDKIKQIQEEKITESTKK